MGRERGVGTLGPTRCDRVKGLIYICCAQTSNLRKPPTRGHVTGSNWSVVVGLRRAWAASRARSVGDVDGQNSPHVR